MQGERAKLEAKDVLVDAHVHYYDCFSLRDFLDSAEANFLAAAADIGIEAPCIRVLMLTEGGGHNFFGKALEMAESDVECGAWRFRVTSEAESVAVSNSRGGEIFLLAGRQIATEENMEVLAACTDRSFDDDRPITDVIEDVTASGAVAILPWGFGKWSGRRGRIIDRLIDQLSEAPVYLGDNSGRIWMGGEPSQFDKVSSQGKFVLRGTDPLPFKGQEKRVGRFGFHVRGQFDKERPAKSIRMLLGLPAIQLKSYGRLERLIPFVRHQVRMQFRRRLSVRSDARI